MYKGRHTTNYINSVGMKFENSGSPYTITKELEWRNGTRFVEIMFDSGFIDIKTKGQALHEDGCKDRFKPSVHGVGCLGYGARTKDNVKLFDCWRAMIARCYNPQNPSYKTYGAKGVRVCERWKRFDFFEQDIKEVDGFNMELINQGKLCLDKDIKSGHTNMEYNKENCMFVSRSQNTHESATRTWNDDGWKSQQKELMKHNKNV